MSDIAYYRVSTGGQTIAAQRGALTGPMGRPFDKEFEDQGVSGSVLARSRPGFSAMLEYAREGDRLHVSAIDRLGRDALDIQATVRALMDKGVEVVVCGLGSITSGAGLLILAVLAQIAEMEREAIRARTRAGLDVAKQSLAATGRTHRGKTSLGRPLKADPASVAAWRVANAASLSATASHFGISAATVKRYLAPTVTSPPVGDDGGEIVARHVAMADGEIAGAADHVIADTSAGGFLHDISVGPGSVPLTIDVGEQVLQAPVPTPRGDEGGEPFVGEVDLPLFPDLPEWRPGGAHQGSAQIGQQAVPLDDAVVKPRRRMTPPHRMGDGRLVGEGVGGKPPVGSVGSVDDEPMLPFDDPQGGFGEQRGG
ncbi:recombinase family protein [Sphingomonas pseudosanguinis]|nr:recombinase family protein [Sphingomonas pseudosanguinis]